MSSVEGGNSLYILVEGMPGTGKTALTRVLSEQLSATYLKSLVSNTNYGLSLKELRSAEYNQELELLYISDLLLDELRVMETLKHGSVVRDKCYASSLAHLRAHGFENGTHLVQQTVLEAYKQLARMALVPDVAVFLVANLNQVRKHLNNKTDISAWDMTLAGDETKYRMQAEALEAEFCCRYKNQLVRLDCFSATPDVMCRQILEQVSERSRP